MSIAYQKTKYKKRRLKLAYVCPPLRHIRANVSKDLSNKKTAKPKVWLFF